MRLPLVVVSMVSIGIAAGTGCGPIETTVPSSNVVTVPGTGVLNPPPLTDEQVFPTNVIGEALAESVNQSIDTSGYDKTAVKSLKMTTLKLTVLEPNQGNVQIRGLRIFESLTVFLGQPGEPIKVAESEDGIFNSNPIEYDVPLTGAELADAVKASDSLEMTADVVPGEPPQFATDVQIDSEMTIQIGL